MGLGWGLRDGWDFGAVGAQRVVIWAEEDVSHSLIKAAHWSGPGGRVGSRSLASLVLASARRSLYFVKARAARLSRQRALTRRANLSELSGGSGESRTALKRMSWSNI